MSLENTKVKRSDVPLNKGDFVSDQMVKWCPGCGAHAILSAVANVFPKIGYRKENFMFVSGIGCSSRFPYYVNTYGFHGIHGRALSIASGIAIANPHLSIWIATGDGDSMAIGGNHFIHTIRRNIDVNVLLFNNEIYGLTKGQFSPTTPIGSKTKTSPYGTIEHPFNPGELVLGAQGTFFARAVDNNLKLMSEVIYEAARHDGTSIIEILQNCIIFNDKAFEHITTKDVRDDHQIFLKNGEPMIFGKNKNKGLRLNGIKLEVVNLGENGIAEKELLVHDQYEKDPTLHLMLAKMKPPSYPLAMGVIRSAVFATYDDLLIEQSNCAKTNSSLKNVDDLLNSGDTWEI